MALWWMWWEKALRAGGGGCGDVALREGGGGGIVGGVWGGGCGGGRVEVGVRRRWGGVAGEVLWLAFHNGFWLFLAGRGGAAPPPPQSPAKSYSTDAIITRSSRSHITEVEMRTPTSMPTHPSRKMQDDLSGSYASLNPGRRSWRSSPSDAVHKLCSKQGGGGGEGIHEVAYCWIACWTQLEQANRLRICFPAVCVTRIGIAGRWRSSLNFFLS